MSSTPVATILEAGLSESLEAYIQNQLVIGKDIKRVMRRVMAYWISFAVNEIPPPDREKLRAYLLAQARTGPARQLSSIARLQLGSPKRAIKDAKRADELRNTVASKIVAALNYYGARHLRKDSQAAQFYAKVSQFITRRTGSSGLMRAGFIPAFQTLRPDKAPALTKPQKGAPPGDIKEDFAEESAAILVDNWAAQREDGRRTVRGVGGLAPRAFESVVPDIEALYQGFLLQNIREQGARAGFRVS